MRDERAKYLIIDSTEINKQLYKVTREFSFNDFYNVYEPSDIIDASEMFEKLVSVLGLLYERKSEALDDEIEALIQKRQEARKNRDFAAADAIRDELKAQGIILEDTAQGVKWHRA